VKHLSYYALEAASAAEARAILDQERSEEGELFVSPDALLARLLELEGLEESEGDALWPGEGGWVRVRCASDRVRIEQGPAGPLAPVHEPLRELFAELGLALYWPDRDELVPPPAPSQPPAASSRCEVCGNPGIHFACPTCGLEVAGTCFRCHRDLCGAGGFSGLDALLGL